MLRITGGQFGGRKLHSPPETGAHAGKTRPSQAKLRQALFNTLQADVGEARVLDLFAGGGTLGFEALSRGAASVVFVEAARPVSKVIEKNAAELKVSSQVRVFSERVEKAGKLIESSGPFDLVLVDPPYLLGVELDLLSGKWWDWSKVMIPGGKLLLEWGRTKSQFVELPELVSLPEKVGFLIKVREKNYGDSLLSTYRFQTEYEPAVEAGSDTEGDNDS